MKLKIEKLKSGEIKLELTTDASKKPLAMTLKDDQIDGLVSMLNTVRKADLLKFELEL